ncbi:hypothetical protein V1517DRAFT_265704 [Lipomyces orientalis]|uniref:Uncharacterized protein n=1 Tax=Lipomyces orientalis TaxID=1233043 RepID=A0ACC3TFT9_9ASCO
MPAARQLVPAALPPALEKFHRSLLTHHLFYAPLLNWVVIFVFLVFIIRLILVFNSAVAVSPLIIMSVSNVLLFGLSDALAQTVVTISENYASSRRSTSLGVSNNSEKPPADGTPFARTSSHVFVATTASHFSTAAFKFDRVIRFATWGFLLSTFLFKWLELLHVWIPITEDSVVVPVLLRVLADQLIWTPISLSGFFAFISFVEGGSMKAVKHKLSTLLIPTLKSNYMVWPAAQIINFRLIPLHLQLPFISTVGLLWNIWLSIANSSSTEV